MSESMLSSGGRHDDLTVVELDSTAIDYLRERLYSGQDAASRRLPLRTALAGLPLNSGTIWTWGPRGVVIHGADLAGGLPDAITQEGHRQALSRLLTDYLAADGKAVLLEDHDASPTDQFMRRRERQTGWKTYNEFVYWYSTTSDQVADMLQAGLGLYNCLALTRPTETLLDNKRRNIQLADIEDMSRATEQIVVDAFDFEGFIVWSRSTSRQPSSP